MTIEQLEAEIGDRKVIRHQFQCFVNVRTDEEKEHFESLGAHSRPFTGHGIVGHEVFLAGMLDPVIEEGLDGPVDVTAHFLLNHFRERDGFSGQGRYATLFA